jgi:formiminotetrahydrofolate cyclodeaminase
MKRGITIDQAVDEYMAKDTEENRERRKRQLEEKLGVSRNVPLDQLNEKQQNILKEYNPPA